VTAGTDDPAMTAGWWQRMVPWWHVAFAITLAVTAALALFTGAPLVVLAPLLLLAVAYVTLGVPALRRDTQIHGAVYFFAAAVLLVWTVHLSAAGLLLLICLYPQCFAMLDPFRRAALTAVVLTAVGYTANAGREGWTRGAVTGGVVSGLINVTVALAIGLFVDRLLRESARRATLVAALTAAQQELADAQHLAGVQAERERLAREIHDTLAQGFTSIVMLARAIEVGLEEHSDVRDKLALLEETAQANLAEARALVAALPPADLHDGGLLGALRRATDRCARENGVPTELSVRGTPRALASSYDVVLLRVAQEALANVGKHSRAQHVTLTVTYGATSTSLEVRDDGVGLSSPVPGGFGLAGMRQRVEEAAGQLCVEATPGGGTTVRVVLP
jgi:signal transduction histidine kinase